MNITELPKFWCYTSTSSDIYGVHSLAFSIGDLTLYFSYKTVVGFLYKEEQVCCQNEWGPTTGKHLNVLEPDKKRRVPRDEFISRLNEILVELGLEQVKQ